MHQKHWRIDITTRDGLIDAAGQSALAEIKELGLDGISRVRFIRGYQLDPGLPAEEVKRAAQDLLADPVAEDFQITPPGKSRPAIPNCHRLEVLRKPGVMDPVAGSAQRVLGEMGITTQVHTFRGYEIHGKASVDSLQEAVERSLANGTIEDIFVDSPDLPFAGPPAEFSSSRTEVVLESLEDSELEAISKKHCLSLTVEEMRCIQKYFRELKRNPTDAELETLAQTWSEHCKHKTLAGPVQFGDKKYENLLKETIFEATRKMAAPWCLSVFKDNAGIVELEKDWAVCFKVETHNHPSAIEPYGGAGTGIGGVIRDILGCGLGAKPIASTDVFCVGPLNLPRDAVPTGSLHPKRVLKGVVAGVRDYGNRMGIPTVNGGVLVDPDYIGNPLVFCGNVGLLRREHCDKEARTGDIILVVGGRTGRDGIHGATFSSAELHEESETVSSTAVQIGDPITEKKVMEGLLRARDRGLYHAVTDCGAGGLSSAVGEMGEDLGAEVNLEKVPLKYPGLTYAEIWISEAQERMVLAVPPDKLSEILEVFGKEEVEATPIGTFTDTHRLVLRWHGETVGDLDMEFLHHGLPKVTRQATWNPPAASDPALPEHSPGKDFQATLKGILSSPNVASKEWIIRQYDHEVQGGSVLKPLVGCKEDGPGDAAVISPLEGSHRGLAIGCGINPRYGRIHPYHMAASAIDEALRNVVAVGGDPERTAILDNFSWGNCDRPENLGSLVKAAEACHDVALAFGTPFISGKDSLNNEYRVGKKTIIIPPTLLISAMARVPDIRRCVSMDLKKAGSRLLLVGLTKKEFGGSHFHLLHGLEGGRIPEVDLDLAPRIMKGVSRLIQKGFALACHDLSEGGLAVAAAEMAFSGNQGASLQLDSIPRTEDAREDLTLLFSESNSRFLLEIPQQRAHAVKEILGDLPWAWVGETQAEPTLSFYGLNSRPLMDCSVEELKRAWQETLAW